MEKSLKKGDLDGSWIHPKLDDECHASPSSPQLWYGFLGHSNSWEDVVRKLHLSRTPTRKSRRVWVQEIWVTRTEVPSLHSPMRLIHRWGRDSLRKRQERQETWRFRRLYFPAGRSSTLLASESSTFPEWICTSTMDRGLSRRKCPVF